MRAKFLDSETTWEILMAMLAVARLLAINKPCNRDSDDRMLGQYLPKIIISSWAVKL